MTRQTSVRGVVLGDDDTHDVRRQKMARIILDSMYQFLGLLDVDGTVLEINQAALDGAGLHLSDVVGRPFWEARWWSVSVTATPRAAKRSATADLPLPIPPVSPMTSGRPGARTAIVDPRRRP